MLSLSSGRLLILPIVLFLLCFYVTLSLSLDDLDLNGFLDVVVWGTVNNQNCILPFIHQSNGTFLKATQILMQPTSNPFIVSFGQNNGQKTIALAAYQNGSRVLLKYEPNTLNL